MLSPLFAVFLIFASIEARKAPKIQIFEIRDRGNNGIELRDLAFIPESHKRAESKLLNLFQSKKQKKTQNNVTEQLIEELKKVKGDEGNKISDDAFVHVLRNVFDDSDSTSEEVFVDKTRNDRPDPLQPIRNILRSL
ncbi:unnamed protein product [Arctia plantaginis]|uniref:Uncharacterized protein n=1 Tax=Arctia plantaginis TaxID=874455 RepID=A0A8S1B4Z7_ARCPL|nr:unnamed protein product [Arctia plantaginis]